MEDEVFRQDLKKGQASQFFEDMMFSGMDRILCVRRVREACLDQLGLTGDDSVDCAESLH